MKPKTSETSKVLFLKFEADTLTASRRGTRISNAVTEVRCALSSSLFSPLSSSTIKFSWTRSIDGPWPVHPWQTTCESFLSDLVVLSFRHEVDCFKGRHLWPDSVCTLSVIASLCWLLVRRFLGFKPYNDWKLFNGHIVGIKLLSGGESLNIVRI